MYPKHFKQFRESDVAFCGRSLDNSWTIFPLDVQCKDCIRKMARAGI